MQRGTLTHPIYHAVLRRVWGSSERTRHLEFEVANGKRFDFRSGQFIALHFYQNGEQHVRAFSMATAYRADNCFELCLNLKREGNVYVGSWASRKAASLNSPALTADSGFIILHTGFRRSSPQAPVSPLSAPCFRNSIVRNTLRRLG